MTPALALEEAQRRLVALAQPLATETVAVAETHGRYCAEPLVARRTQPPADLSAMDGFALHGEGPWQIVGESRAGHPFGGSLGERQAVRISTGAVLPDGADTILIREDAALDGDRLALAGDARPTARHIRRQGFDFAEGDELLPTGARLGPAAIALALAAGHGTLAVRRRPRLAILDCGDELAADPEDCGPGRIPASNGAMLAAMTASIPCTIRRIGPVADDLGALVAALEQAGDADLVVTSGGVSVGDHDLVRPALEKLDARIDFWRVAIRPGKPLMVATRGERIVLGLPGNPVSSFVTGFLFMLPVLRAMAGDRAPLPRPVMLPLGEDIAAGGARREFRRARLAGGALHPLPERDSSALRTLAAADALIDRPAQADGTKAGTYVPAYLLENGGLA